MKQETKQELLDEIEALRKKVEAFTDGTKGAPSAGDKYWLIPYQGAALGSLWYGTQADIDRLSIGNIFLTQEAVEKEVARRKLIQELKSETDFVPDWGDDDQDKYSLSCCHRDKNWRTSVTYRIQYDFTPPYFETRKKAQAVIDKYGDRLNVLLD